MQSGFKKEQVTCALTAGRATTGMSTKGREARFEVHKSSTGSSFPKKKGLHEVPRIYDSLSGNKRVDNHITARTQ